MTRVWADGHLARAPTEIWADIDHFRALIGPVVHAVEFREREYIRLMAVSSPDLKAFLGFAPLRAKNCHSSSGAKGERPPIQATSTTRCPFVKRCRRLIGSSFDDERKRVR
jgi:hypothetical protein